MVALREELRRAGERCKRMASMLRTEAERAVSPAVSLQLINLADCYDRRSLAIDERAGVRTPAR